MNELNKTIVKIIGAGLAGAEAAWQIANRGIPVELFEMRPQVQTPAHKSGEFAELVCSNSFRGASLENAVGLLKEEMRRLNSLIMATADRFAVPAGGALAVDRELFSSEITKQLTCHDYITVHRLEITEIPKDGLVIIATGPLTSASFSQAIADFTGQGHMYFYDAAAPIVETESVDFSVVFWASRYDKGDADYANCPMNQEEYERFYQALINAELHPLKEFEKEIFFEGCMPVEVMAKRGPQTLLFGPLKPVGLLDPRTGKRPYAVVQLRKENLEGTMLNLVGFQTHLKWPEQKKVFRLIPGLERAEFLRYGMMHRNTFINGPKVLKKSFQTFQNDNIFFAGQITGVEGYVESAASGLIAGINAARLVLGQEPVTFPDETALGALSNHVTNLQAKNYQPMNITFGLLPTLAERIKGKRIKNKVLSERALKAQEEFCQLNGL